MAAWFPYDLHILIASLVYLVWYYYRNAFERFKKDNIPCVQPSTPFGNIIKSTLRMQHPTKDITDIYNKFHDRRYFGFFQLDNGVLVLRDPELIKKVAVKDYEYFLNHRAFVSEELDPLFGRNLFSLKDNKWRNMRSTLSPAFTGSKMKHMCKFMANTGQQVSDYLMKEVERTQKPGEKRFAVVELKDLCTRFTSDAIATTAFGVEVDSLNEPENEFYMMGKQSTNFDGIVLLKFYGYLAIPKIMKLLKIRLFSEKVSNFYRHLVQDTMTFRAKENIYRPDMIHLLMEAKKGTLKYEEQANGGKAGFATVEEADVNIGNNKIKWEDDDLTAQAILFLLAGFDVAANLMCFIFYELAMNPAIHKKLQDEIDASIEQNGETLTYETLQKLTYLDMVVSETLRKWPPSVVTDRECTKDYDLGPSQEGSNDNVVVKRGEYLWLPIHAIHQDPKYWPEPEKFDPERFSDENKSSIQSHTFLPFGVGPRNCVGSRYALMEAKTIVYQLMSKFNVEINSKTVLPLQLANNSFNLKARKGFWMNFVPRK